MRSAFTCLCVFLLGIASLAAQSSTGIADNGYEIYRGDINGDGLEDLYFEYQRPIILLHGEIVTPITLPGPPNFVLYGTIVNGELSYAAPDAITLEESVISNLEQMADGLSFSDDFNGDGETDLMVLGAVPLTLYANGNDLPSLAQISSLGNDISNAALTEPELPTHDATVGQLNPQVSVNGGTVNLSLPIVVPPGRAGIQPKLTLKYSSTGGNGLLGVGGSLAVGGAIKRCADIYQLDNRSGSVTDDANDKLCLNGERLVSASGGGTYGASGSVYYPETKPQLKISQSGTLSSASFTIKHSDGTVDYYGDNTNSRVSRNGTRVAWKLRKSQDFHNNSVIYTYTAYEGGSHLSNIYYTGNGNTQGNRRVQFIYEARDDIRVSYRYGARKRVDKRLKQVRTYANGNKVRDYHIAYYANTTLSKLQSVTLCGWDTDGSRDECYPATHFEWDNWQPGFADTPVKVDTAGNYSLGFYSGITRALDYDGDGQGDLVLGELGTRGTAVLSATGARKELLYVPGQAPDPIGVVTQPRSFSNNGIDINGDGRADNVDSYGTSYGYWNGSDFVRGGTGIPYGCNERPYYPPRQPHSPQYQSCFSYSLDFDGDGRQDIAVPHHPGAFLDFYRANGDGSFTFKHRSDATISLKSPMIVTDYDGDGDPDLVGADVDTNFSKKIVVLTTQWNGGSLSTEKVFPNVDSLSRWEEPLFLDANQDGLLDMLGYLNTGGDLVDSMFDLTGLDTRLGQQFPPDPGRLRQSFIRILDYNGDGIADLLMPDISAEGGYYPFYKHRCHLFCQPWGPDTIGFDEQYSDQFDLYKWRLHLGRYDSAGKINYTDAPIALPIVAPLTDLNLVDYDGDGDLDIATRFGSKIMRNGEVAFEMSGPYANKPGVYVYYNQSDKTDQVSKITTGLGVKHEFDYAMLHSDDGFYSVTSTSQSFPNINGSTNSNAVSEYRTSDGLSGLSKTTFRYKDALSNLQGRGHQGFAEITERKYASALDNQPLDNQPYAEVVTTFAQDFPKSGSVLKQITKVRNGNGNLVKTASVDNQLTVVNGQLAPTRFVYAKTSTGKKYELDGSLISTETVTRTHNYLGLLTDKTAIISDFGGDVTKTTISDNNYTLDTTNWWFKLNSSSERHQVSYKNSLQLPGEALTDVTVSKTFAYSDSGSRRPTRITTASNDTSLNLITTNRYSGPYKQLDRVTLTSNGSGSTSIEGSRWTTMGYSSGSDHGYFVTKTYNSAWGTTLAANSATYDRRTGLPLTETDANGNTTANQYDHFGHLIEVNAPGVPKQKLSRQWCSSVCPTAASNRHAVYFDIAARAGTPPVFTYYDALGREVYRETEVADGTVLQWQEYDNRGRVTQVVDPHYSSAAANDIGSVDFTGFDGLSRPTAKTVSRRPINYSVVYDYSGFSTDITVTPNGLGPVLAMASRSSVLGQPLYHRDAAGQYTRFRYDALGNVAMIQDVSGNAITASYNGLGHKLALNDPNMGGWQFAYNALGELRWQRDAKAQVTTFNYDNLGRLTDTYPGGDAAHHFQFDASARGTLDREYSGSSSNPEFERIYSYDSLQRETARTTQIDNRVFVQKTAWDGNYGRIKGMRYPDGTIVETLYDETGRIAEERDFIEGIRLRTIDSRSAFDAIRRQSFANALIEESQYNASGLLEQRCVSSILGNCNKSNLIYDQYDSYGNLKHRRNGIAKVEESFVYDNLHRLTQSTRSWDTRIPATLHSTVDYDYDAAGNLLYKTDFSDTSANAYQYGDTARATNNAGPNAVAQVTLADHSTRSFQYDLNGNLTADGLRTISYGVNNKPGFISHSNGNSASFHYGPDQRRYKQVATDGSATTTRYYLGAYEYEETLHNGDTTTVHRTAVADFAQYRIETLNGAVQLAGWEFLHRDHLGSIESVSDMVGAIRERRGFDPFGKARDLNEDDTTAGLLQRDTTKRGFTDHEHLDGVELIHMNGRAYDYNLGRFLSVDPFIAMPANSQAYNPYSYVMNNPLRYTDPTGYVQQLSGTNETVTDDAAIVVQDAIDACNGSRCGGVVVKLSDGTTVIYLKSNGSGRGKVGEAITIPAGGNENKRGSDNLGVDQSNESLATEGGFQNANFSIGVGEVADLAKLADELNDDFIRDAKHLTQSIRKSEDHKDNAPLISALISIGYLDRGSIDSYRYLLEKNPSNGLELGAMTQDAMRGLRSSWATSQLKTIAKQYGDLQWKYFTGGGKFDPGKQLKRQIRGIVYDRADTPEARKQIYEAVYDVVETGVTKL